MEPYEYQTMRLVEDTYWWYASLHKLVSRTAASLLAGKERHSVLDAGCGTGGSLAALKKSGGGTQLFGVDINSAAAGMAARRNVARISRAAVESLPFGGEAFDLVVSTDVLYMKGVDELEALSEFRRVLKPGGYLILNLAAFEFLRGQHDLAVYTARRYSKREVKRLLEESGFQVVLQTYWNALLFPILACWRPLSRIWASKTIPVSDLKVLPRGINWGLTRLLDAEIFLARHISLPFGSSIFTVARRK